MDHFHLFFADALRAAHPMLFPPRDFPFPKLFATESPEDATGETRPFSPIAPSVPSTHPVRTASFTASFLWCLSGFGLVWFGFGTCSQSPASAWECWGYRHVPLSLQQLYCLLCGAQRAESFTWLSGGSCTCGCVTEDPSLTCKV